MGCRRTCRAADGAVTLWRTFLVVCVVLLQRHVVWGSGNAQPTVEGTKVTCANTSGNVHASVVLKPGGTPLEVRCRQHSDFNPPRLVDKVQDEVSPSVCKASDAQTPTKCFTPVLLSGLIPGATFDWTKWIQDGYGATLTIPQDMFPLTKQTFAVGCVDVQLVSSPLSNEPAAQKQQLVYSCMVTVTVEPRAATALNNVVSCSYPDNTEANVPVKLTPFKRSFELVCGTGNTPQPGQYTKQFCSGSTVKDCTLKSYTDIFTDYEEGWWSTPDGQNKGSTVKFEIPASQFPSEKKTFLVGCEAPSSAGGPKLYCSVPVTVDPAGGSEGGGGSSASIRTYGRETLLLGIFLVPAGLFVSSC
ncbi:surface antigen [Cystoisospora suis]|uniref:Surface antigen n=1 Tax=Cystoisospora suis TaxID=483139 RepID=A0A2C6LB41_9APIC|nr:surface antigen [Cystoisospora suis]